MQKTKIVLMAVVAVLLGGIFVYFFTLIQEKNSHSSVATPYLSSLSSPPLPSSPPPGQVFRLASQKERIVYLKNVMGGDTFLMSSNFDGSRKEIIQKFPNAFDKYSRYIEGATIFVEADISYRTEKIIYVTDDGEGYYALWLIDAGAEPKKILVSRSSISNAILSPDGEMVTYMADRSHLRMIHSDGRYDTPLINDVSHSVKEDHPYQFVPFAWSFDKSRIYMRRTTDLPVTAVEIAGTYVVDVEKKEIQKISDFTASVSPDGSMLAYVGYVAKRADQGDGPPMISVPPFTLNAINAKSGEIKKLAETREEPGFISPIWSGDSKNVAYISKEGLFVMDVQTLETSHINISIPTNGAAELQIWMGDRIFYKENTKLGYSFAEVISSVKVDGTEIQKIDSEGTFRVVGTQSWHW